MQDLTRRPITMSLFGLLAIVFLTGNRPNCDRRDPTLTTCDDALVYVAPGTCVDLDNPCDAIGAWERLDGFRLCDEPEGLFVNTTRRRIGVTRQLCAAVDVGELVMEPVTYVYTKPNPGGGRPDFGEAQLYITTLVPLAAVASAVPSNVLPGDPVQLDVDVTGGTAPYTYAWTANPTGGGIAPGDETLQNPLGHPDTDTTYTALVTDAIGDSAADSVDVHVAFSLIVSATPDTISLGESSQLTAEAAGGAPPYTYAWGPVASLDDPSIPTPLATPAESTTYQVTVTDDTAISATDSVAVTVLMYLYAWATPETIDAGQTALLSTVVAGGKPPYTYSWAPANGLDPADEDNPEPSVTPSVSTTYTVTVTDDLGQMASTDVRVTVNPATGPVACFTVTPDPPRLGEQEVWDASCSTGTAPLSYRWKFELVGYPVFDMCFGAGADPSGGATSPCSEFTFQENLVVLTLPIAPIEPGGGTRRTTLWVRDADGNVATTFYEFPW